MQAVEIDRDYMGVHRWAISFLLLMSVAATGNGAFETAWAGPLVVASALGMMTIAAVLYAFCSAVRLQAHGAWMAT